MSKFKNMKMVRSRSGIAVLAAVATAVVVGGVSYASIPTNNGVINGCYQKAAAANGTHALTVINTSTTSTCPSGYKTLNWNAGFSPGYSSSGSDIQLMDTFTYVADDSMPAGS